MNLRIKYLVERMLQGALQLFRIFPIRKNRIVFSSFSGRQYSDSPKRISDELLVTHPEYEQVWAFLEPEKYEDLRTKGITVVKFKSLKYLYYTMTCKVFVDNVEFWSILKFRPKQMVLQTWHGGGLYKRVGADRLDVGTLELQHVIKKMEKNTVFVSSSRGFTERVIRGAFSYKGEVLEVGLPRNDELINIDNADCERLKKQLGIPMQNRTVLYAPTFRNSLNQDLYDVDIPRLINALNRRFGGQWTVITRMHYYMSDQAMEMSMNPDVIDATHYPDMQPLLKLADVLITDYSSTVWDFSLMQKPCFVYARDIHEYSGERNFYLPLEQWPAVISVDNNTLESAILSFDDTNYNKTVVNHHAALGNVETGNATQLVCKRIKEFIEEN